MIVVNSELCALLAIQCELMEGHFKKLPYLSSPMASIHSTFPLTEVLVSEVPTIYPEEIHFERSEFGGINSRFASAAEG